MTLTAVSMRRTLLFLVLLLLTTFSESAGQAQAPQPTSPPNSLISSERYIRAGRLGIAHINSAELEADETRYQNALILGTGWDRWPLYWNRIEVRPGTYDWSLYDKLVTEDLSHQLRINAILLGKPAFYQDGERIAGMHTPIFSDGTDSPGEGKEFNPENPWARFVYETVNRYKPGGELAQENGWSSNVGVSVWEIWNEPDYTPFWSGTQSDYARLLKVAYIVAKMADPNSRIMFGGLNYGDDDNWLAWVLAIYQSDPMREQYNWYMDIVAVHSYTYPRRTASLVRFVKETLVAYGLDRPIWVNESGVPVWDDYPGPTWATSPAERVLRTTAKQQAAFFIQSTVYAWAEGADVVFYHQLYDDCGNQPAGTDFPVHNGELCATVALCAGDAFGLYRNPTGAACYSQHPFPGTPRPSAAAFQLLAEVFGTGPFDNPRVEDVDDRVKVISFDRLTTDERIYVVWNRTFETFVFDLAANGDTAHVYTMASDWAVTPNENGAYALELPAAAPDDYPYLRNGDITGVEGEPLILIEHFPDGLPDTGVLPTQEAAITIPEVTAITPLEVTPGAVQVEPGPPTTIPSEDVTPPTASISPLATISPTTFMVSWSGEDDSAIESYLIWVRVNGGEWQPWLETTRTEAQYTGEPGNTYDFAAWAVDLGGNWSTNTDLTPQATTQIE